MTSPKLGPIWAGNLPREFLMLPDPTISGTLHPFILSLINSLFCTGEEFISILPTQLNTLKNWKLMPFQKQGDSMCRYWHNNDFVLSFPWSYNCFGHRCESKYVPWRDQRIHSSAYCKLEVETIFPSSLSCWDLRQWAPAVNAQGHQHPFLVLMNQTFLLIEAAGSWLGPLQTAHCWTSPSGCKIETSLSTCYLTTLE